MLGSRNVTLPRHGPLIWGLQRLGYRGKAEQDMGFELQTGSGLGKRVAKQKVSERCMLSEGSGKAVVWCRVSEQFGMAAVGQRQSELEMVVGWCRQVVFAWSRLTVEVERAAEQCMLTETGFAQGKMVVWEQPLAVLFVLTVLFGGRGNWVAQEPLQV